MATRVIFMGTAELACASLTALLRQESIQLLAVVTQPDRPGGRHLQPQPSPVKRTALAAQLPIFQPERARDPAFIQQLRDLQPDLIVVAAYGQILPAEILNLPKHGCLNVHTSLLPKYRGASPIQSAILNDDAETGVTIMQMDAGMDTGPVLTQATTPIAPTDNAETLHDRLAQLGADLLLQTIPDYVTGKIAPHPQPDSGVSHAAKIKKQDGLLEWKLPARQLWCRLRAFTPWPGVFTHLPRVVLSQEAPRLLKIWKAEIENRTGPPGELLEVSPEGIVIACGRDALRILELQLEGGRRLAVREFLAGHPLAVGQSWA